MVFNDPTNKTGLVQDIDFLAGTDNTSYPLADKTRNINNWYQKVGIWIWQASASWEFDDSNYTDLPIATTNLADNQRYYNLPTTAFSVKRAEIKKADNNEYLLEYLDERYVPQALDEFGETKGEPRYYFLINGQIGLIPNPDATKVNTLKIYISREVSGFVPTDTTKEPGFAEPFHRILSLGAAYEYLLTIGDMARADRYMLEIEKLRKELIDFYSRRAEQDKPRIQPFIDHYI